MILIANTQLSELVLHNPSSTEDGIVTLQWSYYHNLKNDRENNHRMLRVIQDKKRSTEKITIFEFDNSKKISTAIRG